MLGHETAHEDSAISRASHSYLQGGAGIKGEGMGENEYSGRIHVPKLTQHSPEKNEICQYAPSCSFVVQKDQKQ